MNPLNYILDGHEPVVEPDLLAWARWMGEADRRVAYTEINGYRISTVFLGLDHNYSNEGPPLLFETMIFLDNPHDPPWDNQACWRCSTWDEALQQHDVGVSTAMFVTDVIGRTE